MAANGLSPAPSDPPSPRSRAMWVWVGRPPKLCSTAHLSSPARAGATRPRSA